MFFHIFRHPSQFREVAVDPGVRTLDGQTFDILFVGTDQGQVLKIVQPVSGGAGRAVLAEDLAVVEGPVLGLTLAAGQLMVTTQDQLIQLPLSRCGVAVTCSACVRLQVGLSTF